MGLGIVAGVHPEARRVILRTPVRDLRGIDTLRIGDLHVDPETFEDRQLRR
jgi:polynucleotide 5'-kinase involved in rRNA processing